MRGQTYAFALIAVWNPLILSELHTTVTTANPFSITPISFSTDGLAGITGVSSGYQPIESTAKSTATAIGIIAGATVGGLILFCCLIIGGCFICQRCRKS